MATKQSKQDKGFGVLMLLEKETKGALRYVEVDDDGKIIEIAAGAKIGTLYIRKSAFGSEAPKSIMVGVDIN